MCSYHRIFSDTHADGIFAAEESGPGEPWTPQPPEKSYINQINAGVYAVQVGEGERAGSIKGLVVVSTAL